MRPSLRRWGKILVLFSAALAGAALSAGALPIPIATVDGLRVSVDHEHFADLDPVTTEVVYPRADPISYRLIIENVGEVSRTAIDLQSWLASDRVSCEGKTERRPPGNPFSPSYTIPALAPGERKEFDIDYAPSGCSFQATVRVSLRYLNELKQPQSATVDSPAVLRFR